MTDDLVKRLRNLVGQYIGDADIDDELQGAADRIEQLEKAVRQSSIDIGRMGMACGEVADRIEKLEALLKQRDLFIVKQGLWTEFVTTLEGKDD